MEKKDFLQQCANNWKKHLDSLSPEELEALKKRFFEDKRPKGWLSIDEHLPYMLQENPETDVILVPRINTVEGLTPEHIQKWGWNVNEKGWVNFPDYQWRIYRNCPEIKWVNKVHERLDGFKSYATLEATEYYNLYHPKTIAKQEKQNNYYDTL